MGLYSEEQLQQRLVDISRFRFVLAPASYSAIAKTSAADACRSEWQYLRKAFLHPVSLWKPCRHEALNPNSEIARYVGRHYRLIENVGAYSVLEAIR
jgi:hypothetical protein